MSWISALAPWQWAIFAAVPVGIVLLYFLKLRREPVEVPSTYLWSRTIEDLHVNSLMQRLRRSLLLFLQLLAVALAAMALLRPGIRGDASSQGRTVYLLDTSASMQATDGVDGKSRFETARDLIRDRIEGMSDSETAMLVTFSDRPDTVQSFTTDRRRLRDALSRVQVTNHPTDILGALKAADGLANPRRSSEVGNLNDLQVADAMPADLLVFSDGGFQPVTEFNLGNLIPQYVAIGGNSPNNVAITAFSAERNVEQPTQVQAFATVMNLGERPIETTATLSMESEFLDAASVSLEPGEQTGLSFAIENEEGVSLRLALDVEDDLAVDNVAFAGLTPLRTVRVLVITPGNTPLELGLETEKAAKICVSEFVTPSYLDTDAWADRAGAGTDDLVIFDRCSPGQMPATNTFFIGSLPPNPDTDDAGDGDAVTAEPDGSAADAPASKGWSWASEPGSVVLVDIDRTQPIMRFLEVFSLLIFEGRSISGPAGSFELIAADTGPMLVLSPRDGFQDLVLGFEIISTDADGLTQTNTNWYTERSWPVFLLNLLRYLAGAAEATGAPSYQPGETVRVRLESAVAEAVLKRSSSDSAEADAITTIPTGPNGIIEVVDTEQTGNYRVLDNDRLADLFAINLFDQGESSLAVAPSIELGYEAVKAATGGIERRHEYWRWALLGVLGLLATEWWVFSRRVA
ncbi:hypothetical protein K227x_49050 [Rubripirellula lacrimiformis]|uniref:VWFA domain-containing protein n=1 Tax=Rubripirellula lacrimiformis TaxID=1930273 RepID=A0A517NH85_9BACT|nr:BatA and WFA domain-containing protein [Rubripirellula lacrimiformis]QDT06495.1 hypothetical protein K227x_49050 [Rubripirellula lacrimiformis]